MEENYSYLGLNHGSTLSIRIIEKNMDKNIKYQFINIEEKNLIEHSNQAI